MKMLYMIMFVGVAGLVVVVVFPLIIAYWDFKNRRKKEMKEYEVNTCSMCGAVSVVIDTRPCRMIPGTVRRRRKCTKCRNRWSTVELPYDIARELLKEEAGTGGSQKEMS